MFIGLANFKDYFTYMPKWGFYISFELFGSADMTQYMKLRLHKLLSSLTDFTKLNISLCHLWYVIWMLPCACCIHFKLHSSKHLKYIFGAFFYIACLHETNVLNKNLIYRDTQFQSRLRHCATNQKVTGLILMRSLGFSLT